MNKTTKHLIAGVDEVGRGSIIGSVIAAAVILDPKNIIHGLKDSKKITPKKRNILAKEIRKKALAWSLGRAEHYEIDEINILQGSLLAMQRAIALLPIKPELVLIDGTHCPSIQYEMRAIIKGDTKIAAISAASIIAKVARDAEMVTLDSQYPGYGLAQHKGYPTKKHIAALNTLGASAIHRKSFAPVKKILHIETADQLT